MHSSSSDSSRHARSTRPWRAWFPLAPLALLLLAFASSAQAATYPLAVSANGRYLVDRDGKPFRMQSDAAWLMSTRGTAADVDAYLADRKARGFNTFVLMNIVNTGYGGSEPPNRAGQPPFTKAGDFSTPNEAYFAFIDTIIDKAAAQGMVVLFFYTYLGYMGGDQGWWSIVNQDQNTQSVCFNWGLWLGNRYKNKSNLIWMVGGDYAAPAGEGLTRVHKILEGIRQSGAAQLAGAQWFDPNNLATDETGFTHGTNPRTSDININTFYGFGPGNKGLPYMTAVRGWRYAAPVLPTILFEPPYEGEQNVPAVSAAREATRKYQWWSVLSGSASGQCFGSKGVWPWPADVRNNFDSPGARDQTIAFNFFGSLPWYTLAPSGVQAGFYGRDIVVTGQGGGDAYIAASGTTSGSHLVAFVPPTGTGPTTFAVDLRSMAGPSRARWFDPSSGRYTDITGGAYSLANTQASRAFATPGANSQGTNDWVLVVDANATGTGGAPSNTGGVPSNTGGVPSNNGGVPTSSGGVPSQGSGGLQSTSGGVPSQGSGGVSPSSASGGAAGGPRPAPMGGMTATGAGSKTSSNGGQTALTGGVPSPNGLDGSQSGGAANSGGAPEASTSFSTVGETSSCVCTLTSSEPASNAAAGWLALIAGALLVERRRNRL